MKKVIAIVAVASLLAGAVVAWILIGAPSDQEKSDFHGALLNGDLKKMKTLAQQNPRLINARYKKHTPLGSACCIYSPVDNRNAIVKFLLEQGADPNVDGGACLGGAIYSSDMECIQLLLDAGADPLIKGPDGKTPLDTAKYYDVRGIPEMIERHIGKGK